MKMQLSQNLVPIRRLLRFLEKNSGSSSSHSDSGTPMTANYDVNVRSAPSKDATQVDYIYSGTTVNIIKTVQNGNETWGQIGDDRWVCINDGNLTIIS